MRLVSSLVFLLGSLLLSDQLTMNFLRVELVLLRIQKVLLWIFRVLTVASVILLLMLLLLLVLLVLVLLRLLFMLILILINVHLFGYINMHEVKFNPNLSKFSDLVDECCTNLRSIQFNYGEEIFRVCVGILYCDTLLSNLNKHFD